MKKTIPIIIFMISVIATMILLSMQFKSGLGVTGLNEPSVWGLYITSFTFALGAGAGTLLIIFYLSLSGKLDDKIQLKLSFTALASLALAGIFITLDLGRPERFYFFLTSPNFNSPLVWDFWVMNTLIAISITLILMGLKEKELPKVLSVIFIIITLIAYFITTEAFSSLKARINWNSSVLNMSFIVSALIGGFTLYMLFSDKNDDFIKTSSFKGILTALLVIEAALFFTGYSNTSKLTLVYLIIGNVLPVIMLFLLMKENLIIGKVISILILSSIWFKRSDIISSGYRSRWLPFGTTSYIPTNMEKLLVLNIFIMGIFGLTVILMLLNKKTSEI